MGKPLKAVFAASTRMAAVNPWTAKNITELVTEDGPGELGDDGPLLVAGRGTDQACRVVDDVHVRRHGESRDPDEHGHGQPAHDRPRWRRRCGPSAA